ncbi:MAG: RNA polymerase sigma factor [Methylococcaceae bacterium]|jgi:RNA polymerase sigma-70 factor (ECF subfamily)
MSTRKRILNFLFQTHSKALLAFAGQHSGDDQAEDLVQEAYLRMLQHPELENIENPRAFLYKTTFNLSVDHYRRQINQARYHCLPHELTTELEQIAAPIPIPEDHLAIEQELEQLNDILLKMPELTRYAFVLHRLEGMSHKEVARRLGISTRSSERRIAQAARYLLSQLDSQVCGYNDIDHLD